MNLQSRGFLIDEHLKAAVTGKLPGVLVLFLYQVRLHSLDGWPAETLFRDPECWILLMNEWCLLLFCAQADIL